MSTINSPAPARMDHVQLSDEASTPLVSRQRVWRTDSLWHPPSVPRSRETAKTTQSEVSAFGSCIT
jgi:hypothetical protein